MKNFKVYWTQHATHDLREITDYINQDDVKAAKRIYNEIKEKCSGLISQPERYRIVQELSELGIQHYRQISVAPYRIIFKISDKKIYVFAVVDGRRGLESFLFKRLMRMP